MNTDLRDAEVWPIEVGNAPGSGAEVGEASLHRRQVLRLVQVDGVEDVLLEDAKRAAGTYEARDVFHLFEHGR